MSVQAIAWVLEHSRTRATTRLVMIAIANHVDGRGEGWCYRHEILRGANCSPDSYFRATEAAKKLGELEIDQRGGGNLRMRGGHRPNRFIFPKMVSQIAEMCDPQVAALTPEGCDPQVAGLSEDGCDPQVAALRDPQVAALRDPQVAGHTHLKDEPSRNRQGTPAGGPDGLRHLATQVTAAWWGRTSPKPAEDKTSVTAAVLHLLEVGWAPDAISSALDRANVATKNGILIRLRDTAGSPDPPAMSFRDREEQERKYRPPPEEGVVVTGAGVAEQLARVRQAGRKRRSNSTEENE